MSDEAPRSEREAGRAQTLIELMDRALDEPGRTWRTLVLAVALSLPIGTATLIAGALIVWLFELHPLLLASVAGPLAGRLFARTRPRWAALWKRRSKHTKDEEAGSRITAAEE
ncbi:hypothetical protein ACFQS3_06265 [Glycomyces mayteni]|uniref:Uncharacterized protein n=1 Tax=Glycomyces mayteni TaxID=543887 RepID=A0ABW2D399_9ACTN